MLFRSTMELGDSLVSIVTLEGFVRFYEASTVRSKPVRYNTNWTEVCSRQAISKSRDKVRAGATRLLMPRQTRQKRVYGLSDPRTEGPTGKKHK